MRIQLDGGASMTLTPEGNGHVAGTSPSVQRFEKRGGSHVRRMHCHDFYELEMITDGSAAQIINGVRYPIKPGSFFLIRPSDMHRYDIPDGDVLTVVSMRFGSDFLPPELFVELSGRTRMLADTDADRLCAIAGKALTEFAESDRFTPLLLRTVIAELCAILLRSEDVCASETAEFGGSAALAHAAAIVHGQYAKPLTVRRLAELASVSPNHLGQLFLRHTGMSAAAYINRVRLTMALHRVAASDEPIGVIARECGFSDVSRFTREFRKFYGDAPSVYRKKHNRRNG